MTRTSPTFMKGYTKLIHHDLIWQGNTKFIHHDPIGELVYKTLERDTPETPKSYLRTNLRYVLKTRERQIMMTAKT